MKKIFFPSLFILAAAAPLQAADFDARIQFAHKVILSVPVSGEIADVNVKKGDEFKTSDVLLSLNKIPFQAAVSQAESNVRKFEASRREADRDFSQLKELFDRAVLSKVELENGELALKRAEADFTAAKAALTQARYNLEHSTVLAPFNGLVLDVKVSAREMVNNAVTVMPLITVAEKNRYIATAMVPLSTVNQLQVGATSKIAMDNNTYSGKITSVAFEPADSSKSEQTYEVRVEFNSNGKTYRAGQAARITF